MQPVVVEMSRQCLQNPGLILAPRPAETHLVPGLHGLPGVIRFVRHAPHLTPETLSQAAIECLALCPPPGFEFLVLKSVGKRTSLTLAVVGCWRHRFFLLEPGLVVEEEK